MEVITLPSWFGGGHGDKEGSDPQITGQGLVRGTEEDHFTSS